MAVAPFYEDPLVTIYHGDALEILPQIQADLVVTDPPYGIGLDYGEDYVDDWRPDRDFWKLLHRSLPEATSLHMTVSNRHLPYWINETQAGGWNYLHTSVYWNDTRGGGNWNGMFAYAWEPMLSFSRGNGFKLRKRMLTDVFSHGGQRTTKHPAERAISAWGLFVDLLPDGVILDPFLGTGTTLRACKDRGRPAIGIELNEKFCHLAAERCAQEVLFVD